MPGPWIVVTADQEFRVEKRLIDTEFRVGEWHKDTEGKVVRIRERQNRFEVPFFLFFGGGHVVALKTKVRTFKWGSVLRRNFTGGPESPPFWVL